MGGVHVRTYVGSYEAETKPLDAPVRLNSSGLERESNAIASRLGYPCLVSTAPEAVGLVYCYLVYKPKVLVLARSVCRRL